MMICQYRMGNRFVRTMYIKDLASFIKDDIVDELTNQKYDTMFSIDVLPIPTEEAVREVERKLLGVEKNITDWQCRQNANNNFSATIPYDTTMLGYQIKDLTKCKSFYDSTKGMYELIKDTAEAIIPEGTMENYAQRYDLLPAAAWLRGHSLKTGTPAIRQELLDMPLEVLTDAELNEIADAGVRSEQKLYPFKKGKAELPRCAG